MRQRTKADPVIAAAKRRMIAAAGHYNRGVAEARAELRAAMKALAAHPDYARAVAARRRKVRGREAHTLAYWLHMLCKESERGDPDCAQNILTFGKGIQKDASGGAERMMLASIRDEEQGAKRQAKLREDLRRAAGKLAGTAVELRTVLQAPA